VTDAELILRVRLDGDPNAFAELVKRYQSSVRSFIRKMTRGDAHLADDIAQDTFLRAWQKLDTCRQEAKFLTWLLTIAYNQFRSHLRRRKETCCEDIEEIAREPRGSPEKLAEDLRMDLEQAMKLLSDGERAAIGLCCQQGLTHEEAARILNCPLGTVKTNILRGREKLRRRLRI
jgi:RNA polymerase sigma-70 factor (ECF subfamily)